jgi:hypothetical protein
MAKAGPNLFPPMETVVTSKVIGTAPGRGRHPLQNEGRSYSACRLHGPSPFDRINIGHKICKLSLVPGFYPLFHCVFIEKTIEEDPTVAAQERFSARINRAVRIKNSDDDTTVSKQKPHQTILRRMSSLKGWKAACVWGFAATFGLRIGLGLVMAATWLVVKSFIPVSVLVDPTPYGKLMVHTTFPGDILLGVWVRWDAVHHLNLALRGYFDLGAGESVFYPFFSFLVNAVARLTSGDYTLGGLIVSTMGAFATFTCLYRLVDSIYGSGPARWSVVMLAVYPTSLFLIAPFSESVFLALTIGAFLAAYQRRWWISGGLGFFAGLTRGPGILTVLALAVLAWQQWKRRTDIPAVDPPGRQLSIMAGLLLTAAGGLAFPVWRAAVGFPGIPQVLHDYSGIVLVNPLTGLINAIAQWLRVMDFYTTIDVWSAILFLALTSLMFFNPRWRRPEWLVYNIVNLITFLSKQSFMASSLQSASRYVLTLFPVFIILGDWLARRGHRIRFLYLTLSTLVLMVFGVLYSIWVFVG